MASRWVPDTNQKIVLISRLEALVCTQRQRILRHITSPSHPNRCQNPAGASLGSVAAMYAARPARSVLSRCLQQPASSTPTVASSCRSFQTSACRLKGKPRFRNIKAENMGLIQDKSKLDKYTKTVFPAYSEADKAALRQKYTPEQYEAIMAGEEAIDPNDLTIQGRLREDAYKLEYLEDFATVQPIIDQKPKMSVAPKDFEFLPAKEWVDNFMDKLADHASEKMKDTIGEAVARALRRAKQDNPQMIDFSEEELVELEKNPELRRKLIIDGEATTTEMFDNVESEYKKNPSAQGQSVEWWDKIDKHFFEELDQQLGNDLKNPLDQTHTELVKSTRGEPSATSTALAPELGKVPGVAGLYRAPGSPEEESLDPDGSYKTVANGMGMDLVDVLGLVTKTVVVRRVSQQTRLGKIIRFHAMVVSGNGNGRLGLGEAKSTDPSISTATAKLLALRNMKPIRRYENRTIFGQMEKKVSGTVVSLAARPPGKFDPDRLLSSSPVTNPLPRLRSPRLPPHLRNGPPRRYLRPGSQGHPGQEPHEHRPRHVPHAHEPARPGADRHRSRQEDGRCEEGVLRRICILERLYQPICCINSVYCRRRRVSSSWLLCMT